ncbi:hypothetical protein PGT21_005858 [Puccinia graminis f. sp. tritici]|uniref:Uncharacterized protein n=1 Tax=Puccinia graminis f. sp. tritici TaxID=56615 RepID=A0A5B0QI27_PUCGR|nr:hypothetical protein PGT21_005858 [Puccinia graminis f. sp. tritici]
MNSTANPAWLRVQPSSAPTLPLARKSRRTPIKTDGPVVYLGQSSDDPNLSQSHRIPLLAASLDEVSMDQPAGTNTHKIGLLLSTSLVRSQPPPSSSPMRPVPAHNKLLDFPYRE